MDQGELRQSNKNRLTLFSLQNAERVASTMHRQDTISGLRRFNARRKLKAAMHTARIISRRSTGLCKNLELRTLVHGVSPLFFL